MLDAGRQRVRRLECRALQVGQSGVVEGIRECRQLEEAVPDSLWYERTHIRGEEPPDTHAEFHEAGIEGVEIGSGVGIHFSAFLRNRRCCFHQTTTWVIYSSMAGERILLIEHDPRIREFAASVLDGLEFVVFETDNAKAGLELYELERPHLVIVDEGLPWVGGLDVCVRLRTADPSLPLVLVTAGPADSALLREARSAYDIRHILLRPFTAESLRRISEEALGLVSARLTAVVEPVPEETPRRPFGLGGPVATEMFVVDTRMQTVDVEVVDDDEAPSPELEASFSHQFELPSGSALTVELEAQASAGHGAETLGTDDAIDPAESLVSEPGRRDHEADFALRPMVPGRPTEPQGIYGEILLGDLLYNIFRDIFSGRLVLQRGAVFKSVTIRNGFPIGAESNVRAEELGWRLMLDGTLNETSHARYRALVEREGVDPGTALTRLGVLGPNEFVELQRRLVRERILGCFDWVGAQYGLSYDPGSAEPGQAYEVNPLVLIFEGIKRSFPVAPLVTHFDAHPNRPVRRTEKLRDYARLLRDFPEEMRLAEACDGVVTMGALLAQSSFGMIDTLRVLRAFEMMKCVAFDAGEVPAPARPSQSMAAIRDRGTQPGAPSATGPQPVQRVTRPSIPPGRGPVAGGFARTPSGGHPVVPSLGPRPAAAESEVTSSGSHAVVRPTAVTNPAISIEGLGRRAETASSRPAAAEEAVRLFIADKFSQLGRSNHYEVLEVPVDAPTDAIRNAFMRLARLVHPDQLGTAADDELRRRAAEIQRRVALAWENLSDPRRRQEYDQLHFAPVVDDAGKTDIVKADANFQRGRACLSKGENKRALEFFEAAARQDVHQAVYRIYRGWTRYLCADANDQRTRHEAREDLKSALAADESQDAGYVFLGIISKNQGNEELAERFFRKTLTLNPTNADAIRELRLLEARRRDKPKDGGLFNRLLKK
jgi:curved DNA-binding protein CbpA/CheY-like chemotaxis protein